MDQQIINYVKEIASGLFEKWPITSKVEVREDDGSIKIEIETDKNNIFTQPTPEPLLAVQHILRLSVRKQFPEEVVRVLVDIGGFHKQQQEDLRQVTQKAIEKALESEDSVDMQPMSSFERRLVHVYVAENDKVISESAGSDRDRHVVIKPKV